MNELVPFGAVPSPRQWQWHSLEYYGFLHFGINTFTDREWGMGDESPGLFNPTDFDARQIASAAAAAGMAGLILTCKHHDGFCLWPSRYTEHSVKNSPWKNGKGDMVREVADACRAAGLKFGVYLSPWDRNHADYGRPEYLRYYRNQLEELTTGYGELFEVWFDGANGGDGFYGGARETRQIDRRTYYDWENTWQIVRRNQPGAVMFSDAGPDIRWVGNEKGIAGDPCWSKLTAELLYPGFGGDTLTEKEADMVKAWASDHEMLNMGDFSGRDWLPAECDVSIRPGWFYHAEEDGRVRDPENLMNLYFKSVGRGASLLLNLPPDRRGRIHEKDVQSLMGFRERLDQLFDVNLARKAVLSSEDAVEDPAIEGCSLRSMPGPAAAPGAETDGSVADPAAPGVAASGTVPVLSGLAGVRSAAAAVHVAVPVSSAVPDAPSREPQHPSLLENLVDGSRDTFWTPGEAVFAQSARHKVAEVVFTFDAEITFNVIALREYLPLGQRIKSFLVEYDAGTGWCKLAEGQGVGNRRLLRVPVCSAVKVRLRILESAACPVLSEFGLFFDAMFSDMLAADGGIS